ncbi:hypothetical protein NHH82_28510 [Oxalobacteraceae bacterium OTU3REALA1]|nr:hypothetical protein NHH82_28510 [Oxalobacteraceae bacterium OTU3REALA1]
MAVDHLLDEHARAQHDVNLVHVFALVLEEQVDARLGQFAFLQFARRPLDECVDVGFLQSASAQRGVGQRAAPIRGER